MDLGDILRLRARDAGSMPVGSYRVIVQEPDDEITRRDFDSLDDAKDYANDWASEYTDDDRPAIAYVFDQELQVLHRGRPWWM